jgi:hypothetical protein
MKSSRKPVRPCHGCLLNLGDRCWLYRYPRGRWRHDRHCGARHDETVHARFRESLKEPTVKTLKELRRRVKRAASQ